MDVSGLASAPTAAYAFNDLNGLQALNALGKSNQGAALDAVARQFESFMVAQMLKGMRAANEVFAADNPLNSNEMQFRQEMLDQQLALSMSAGKGLGIAEVFARQLRRDFDPAQRAHAAGHAEARDMPAALRSVERAAEPVERTLPVPARVTAADEPVALAASVIPPVVKSALDIIRPLVERVAGGFADAGGFRDKESFVSAVLPAARVAARRLGIDHRVLIAQSALETGWGQSIIRDGAGRSSNNLFNIKAGAFWDGDTVGVSTLEFRDGLPRRERHQFRSYAGFERSFDDYVALIGGNPRYRAALDCGTDSGGYAHGLQRAGYATDPDYARKIIDILRDPAIAGAE